MEVFIINDGLPLQVQLMRFVPTDQGICILEGIPG